MSAQTTSDRGTGGRLTLTTTHQTDPYAAGADRDVRVFLEVTASGLGAGPCGAVDRSEVVIIDCSGSMAHPAVGKIGAARRAAAEAIAMLPDGTHFALVEGTGTARVAYPWVDSCSPTTVAATPQSRAQGSRTARAMKAHGGTRISAWLELARRLLVTRPNATLRHVLLLTDGHDEHDTPDALRRVLDRCAGQFTCDALGIGEDWDAHQLTEIVHRLHGRAEAVDAGGEGTSDAGDTARRLTGLFRELVGASTSRTLPQLALRVRPEASVRVALVRQLTPTERELTGAPVDGGAALDLCTGAWGDETRWYELRLRAEPDRPRPLADGTTPIASVALVAEGTELPEEQRITVRWTGGEAPPAEPGGLRAHFERYDRLNEAARDGADALVRGDRGVAVRELGTAVRLAHQLRDTDRLRRLARLVTIEDAERGEVRVLEHPERRHVQSVIVASSHIEAPPGTGGVPAVGGPGGDPPRG